MHGQADLLQVVGALHATRGLACRLDRRQQQGDQQSDDGDHHQQLDEREAATFRHEINPPSSRLTPETIQFGGGVEHQIAGPAGGRWDICLTASIANDPADVNELIRSATGTTGAAVRSGAHESI